MKERKGISLIVLIVTIIVMIIIAGAIILSLSEANIIDQAENAVRISEEKNIKDAVLTSIVLTNEGDVNISATHAAAKSVLEAQVETVGDLQEDGTFTVEGKYDTYILTIYQVGVDISSSGNDGNIDETLDGIQGTYASITSLDNSEYQMFITLDGKGNGKMKQQTPEGVTEMDVPYEYDKEKGTLKVEAMGDTAEMDVFYLEAYDNKIIRMYLNNTLTTNGLSGIYMEGLEGKTYVNTTGVGGITKIEFTTDHNVVLYFNNDSQETWQYFKDPTHVLNSEDKFVMLLGAGVEYVVERDSNGDIIKIARTDNSEVCFELDTNSGT